MPSELRQNRDEQRRTQTRQRLLDAAVEVFSDNGYHATLVTDIVRAAGVGQGTFYRNFKDKRAIFTELMELFVEGIFDEFSDMSANPPENQQEYYDASMTALLRAAEALEKKRELALLFLREAPAIDREFKQNMDIIFDRFADLAQHYLDHAIDNGFARPCRSDVVAQSLIGIGVRQIDRYLSHPNPDIPAETMVREIVDFAFFGFGADPTESGRTH